MQSLRRFIERAVNWIFRPLGYRFDRIRHLAADAKLPADFEPAEVEDLKAVLPYTLTSPERIVSLSRAVRHVIENKIPGDFVECGVWKGGSVMEILRTLLRLGDQSRHIYLFDTFAGMTAPTADDVSYDGEVAEDTYIKVNRKLITVSLSDVKRAVLALGYDASKIHFIEGDILQTVPAQAPKTIALLRLDTDWYESTIHEMNHLYPRLSSQGILIVDDYGHWKGSKKAVDEYLATHQLPLFLNRIDYSGRLVVKP
jgi:O-methyltransferase